MIRINVLAADSIKKEERNDILVIAYIVIIILACVAGAQYALKFRAYKIVEGRLARAQQELSKYEEIVRQVDALQATKKVLETKKNVINSLMNGGIVYPHFMEDILQLMPTSIAFKTMNTTLLGEGKIGVTLAAESFDNYAIADFIASLLADPNFASVELGPIVATSLNKTAMAQFTLTCQYQRKQHD